MTDADRHDGPCDEGLWPRLSAWLAASLPRAAFIGIIVVVCTRDIDQLEAIFAMGNYAHMFLLTASLAALFGLVRALPQGDRSHLVRGRRQSASAGHPRPTVSCSNAKTFEFEREHTTWTDLSNQGDMFARMGPVKIKYALPRLFETGTSIGLQLERIPNSY